MLFQWPTFDQMIYRVMRLRRLIAVAVMIPMVFLLGLSLVDPLALSATDASLSLLGVALLIVAHVVLFPNVTLETLAITLAVTGLVVVMPVVRQLALWAPEAQQSGALLLLVGFAVALTAVATVLLQIGLGALVYGGPTLRRVMHLRQTLPCGIAAARQQLALRPASRRGRILTGPADENGFFDVAVATTGPDGAAEYISVDAKVLESSDTRHDVMLLTRSGAMTVTSMTFAATDAGCTVDIRDMPGDFTAGMYLLYWLTDQQADNLTEMTDMVTGHTPRANGLAHHGSLAAAAGAILSPHAPMID